MKGGCMRKGNKTRFIAIQKINKRIESLQNKREIIFRVLQAKNQWDMAMLQAEFAKFEIA
jgi:hypothetical protein